VGGYGGEVCRDLLEEWNLLPVKFIAAHDPMAANFPERVQLLKEHGVTFYDTYEEFLASPIQTMWLPVPIDLHRSMTEKAIAAGKAILCEKPAAGCIQDVEAMIKARDAAHATVAIGYQHLYAASTHELKRRILKGDVGAVHDATLHATWHRTSKYYARPWAAKFQRNGVWLLDSPANNAFAHWVHLLLFLLGPTQSQSANPVAIEAELYRANPIENYDTCCFRIKIETGPTLIVCLSHAANELRQPLLNIYGSAGTLTVDSREHKATVGGGPHPGELELSPVEHLDTLNGFAAFVENKNEPHASLEMSRMHARVISGASQCTPVVTVEPPHMEIYEVDAGSVHHIPGILQLFEAAVKQRKMLHETALAPWTRPAGKIDLVNYHEFTGVPAET